MVGRKNALKMQVLNLIISSPKGIRMNEMQEKLNRHQNSIFYNITLLKEEKKIKGPIERKYFPMKEIVSLRNSYVALPDKNDLDLILCKEIIPHFVEQNQVINKGKINPDIVKENPFLTKIIEFETALINSIKITYNPFGFFLSNQLKEDLIKLIQSFLYRFLFSPGIFHDLYSLGDFNFNFNISIGDNLVDKLPGLNFSEIKKQISFFKWGKKEIVEGMYKTAKEEHVNRDKREQIIEEQLEIIKKHYPDDIVTQGYVNYLRQCIFIKYEDLETVKKNLTTLRKIFLKWHDLSDLERPIEHARIESRFDKLMDVLIEQYNSTGVRKGLIKHGENYLFEYFKKQDYN